MVDDETANLVTRGLLEYGRDGHRVINAVPAVEED